MRRFSIQRTPLGMLISLPPDYRPSDAEEFMNPMQVEYFRQKLLRWRSDLVKEANGTLASLGEGGILEPDITDRASVETDRALELRTRDRARKLISKIDQALLRIENGSYGYCEEGCGGWRRGRLRRCRSRRRSGMSGWSGCTGTIEVLHEPASAEAICRFHIIFRSAFWTSSKSSIFA
jgi:DnaK suppressor protein